MLNLCMNYMVNVSNTTWRIKTQPSISTSCSDNALSLLVLVACISYWGLQWRLHFQFGVAFWRVVLREVYFEGPHRVWRALKTSILNIGCEAPKDATLRGSWVGVDHICIARCVSTRTRMLNWYHLFSVRCHHNITQLFGCVQWDQVSSEKSTILITGFSIYKEHSSCVLWWTFRQAVVDYQSFFVNHNLFWCACYGLEVHVCYSLAMTTLLFIQLIGIVSMHTIH